MRRIGLEALVCLVGVVLSQGCQRQPVLDVTTCAAGTHVEGGRCVADVSCGAGTRGENGLCLPLAPALTCGTDTGAQGGQCVSLLTCGGGTHRDGLACVADVTTPPPTTWGTNVRASARNVQALQPSIAADGQGTVFVGYLAIEGNTYTAHLEKSVDDGATFSTVWVKRSSGGYMSGISVAATPAGDVFVAMADSIPVSQTEAPTTVTVQRSVDRGATWDQPVTVNPDTMDAYAGNPWIAVDDAGGVVVHYLQQFSDYDYRTRYHRSTDRGVSFGQGQTFDPPSGFEYASSDSSAVSLADGTLLFPLQVFTQYGSSVDVAKVAPVGAPVRVPVQDVFYTRSLELNAYPRLARAGDRLCLAFIDAPQRDPSVYVATTAPGATDLGSPVRLDTGAGSTQTLLSLAGDTEGRCHAAWLDNRSGRWEVWTATVRADGTLSPNERASDAAFDEDGGDEKMIYGATALTVAGAKRYLAWEDTREGKTAIYVASSLIAGP